MKKIDKERIPLRERHEYEEYQVRYENANGMEKVKVLVELLVRSRLLALHEEWVRDEYITDPEVRGEATRRVEHLEKCEDHRRWLNMWKKKEVDDVHKPGMTKEEAFQELLLKELGEGDDAHPTEALAKAYSRASRKEPYRYESADGNIVHVLFSWIAPGGEKIPGSWKYNGTTKGLKYQILIGKDALIPRSLKEFLGLDIDRVSDLLDGPGRLSFK
jgi:hypothetical protein